MEVDQFLDLVKKRRSVRRFKPEPIPDEYIEKIIEAARWAMSGANAQPWEFVVVKDQETKNKISESYMEVRQEQYIIEQNYVEDLRHHQLTTPPTSSPGFREAPVLIVVCGDRRTLQATVLASHFIPGSAGPDCTYVENMANAVQIIHLTTAALGLGSQWVSPSRVVEQAVKILLDIPEMMEIHAMVPIGYPAYKPSTPYRRELKEILHFEKYDQARVRSGEDIRRFLLKLRDWTKSAYGQEKA